MVNRGEFERSILVLGEDGRLLSDPYFPRHEELSSELSSALRQLSDFAVRNGEWLRPYTLSDAERETWSQGEMNPKHISMEGEIWTISRSYPKTIVLSLVNFPTLVPNLRWDEAHADPAPSHNVCVKLQMPQHPRQILWDSPEQSEGPRALNFEYSNGMLTFQIPQIHFIGLVAIHE